MPLTHTDGQTSQGQAIDPPDGLLVSLSGVAGIRSCLSQGCSSNWDLDWSKMNLDLYNFQLCSPASVTTQQPFSSASTTASTSRGFSLLPLHCTSWNNGLCLWLFGECRFRHVCSSCDGDHPRVSCPFHSAGIVAPSFPKGWAVVSRKVLYRLVYIVFIVLFLCSSTSSGDCHVLWLHFSWTWLVYPAFIFSVSSSAFTLPVTVVPFSSRVA